MLALMLLIGILGFHLMEHFVMFTSKFSMHPITCHYGYKCKKPGVAEPKLKGLRATKGFLS